MANAAMWSSASSSVGSCQAGAVLLLFVVEAEGVQPRLAGALQQAIDGGGEGGVRFGFAQGDGEG